ATGGPWGIAEREASPLEMLVLEKGLSVSNFQQADETKNLLKSSSNKAISKQQEAIAFLKRQKEEVPEKIQLNLSKTVFDQIFPYLLEQPKPKENQKVLYLNDVQIAAFLLGFVKDSYGRSIQDILNFSLQEKEEEHCYIQWLFPNFSQGVCPKAPLLSATLAKALQQPEAQFMLKSIQESLQKSLESMIKFYGGQLKTSFDYETFDITKAKDYNERVENFKTNRHNERRITRILICLKFFGLDSLAKNFYDYMTAKDMMPTEEAKKHWLTALNRTISYKNFGKNS
ncbi:MAG: hypothetical protein HYS39_03215, partial [Proteobacteria bacterium]|nr:hypothetical protein [Pseudomonadota bacterium]